MINIYFAATQVTALKIATYLKTWNITVFYDADKRMYYVNATSALEMHRIASALALYGLIDDR